MTKIRFSSVLFAILTSLALTVSAAETPSNDPLKVASVQAATVNLNTADAATLERELSGVGATKAQAIVAYREAHGNFASVEELLEVKGIGEATLEKNRAKLMVD